VGFRIIEFGGEGRYALPVEVLQRKSVEGEPQGRLSILLRNLEHSIIGNKMIDRGLLAHLVASELVRSGNNVRAFGPEKADAMPKQTGEIAADCNRRMVMKGGAEASR